MPQTTPRLSFEEAVRMCLRNFINFEGRARRSEFWWFWVFNFLVSLIAILLDSLLFNITPVYTLPTQGEGGGGGIADLGILSAFASLFLFLPYTAVQVRRLHDTNRSGWWVLFFILGFPVFLLGLNAVPSESYFLYILSFALVAILFIAWLAQPGTSGDNRFGKDPRRAKKETP